MEEGRSDEGTAQRRRGGTWRRLEGEKKDEVNLIGEGGRGSSRKQSSGNEESSRSLGEGWS